MELNNCKKKFKDLFEKFFEKDFELSTYYSENLLKFLDGCSDKRTQQVLETPFFSDLIIHSLVNLENASKSVKIFIMEIVQIMLRNELQFSKFAQLEGTKLVGLKLCPTEEAKLTPAMQISAMKLVTVFLTHSTGVMWTVEHKLWERILTPDTHNKPSKTANAVYKYISKLVWKLDEYDEESTLVELLTYIINPIKNNEYLNDSNNILVLDAESERNVYEPIISNLNALLAILNETENITRANKVAPLLAKHLLVEAPVLILLKVTRDPDFVQLLAQVLFCLSSARSLALRDADKKDVPQEITIFFHNIVRRIMEKRLVRTTLHFTVSCFKFWSKMDSDKVPSTFQRHGRMFQVHNQFLLVTLVPLITYLNSINKCNDPCVEYMEAYTRKLSDLGTEHIFKVAHTFRAAIESCEDMKKTVVETLRLIYGIKHCLTEFQTGIVYQAFYYLLQNYVVTDEKGTLTVGEEPVSSPEDIQLLSLVLDLIKILLKEHNINWYEIVEIISLQNCLMNLLKQHILPSKQLIQAIDLIELSINKFLSPDLALLIESRRGSTLNEIVEITKDFLQHPEWEIRDSALHLLYTCTELSYIKYIPLQKLIHENCLIALAAHAALCDEEAFVQATAMRCLAVATKIESLWHQAIMAHPNLCDNLILLLRNNPEGTVRKEAAHVLTEVYNNQKISPEFTTCLYNVMTSTAIDDLHWEVQLEALSFWKIVMQNHIFNKGIIDGKFPTVMFCKAKRKIVTVNETVIQNQLIGIMNDLAAVGCLKVLSQCLYEEYNIQVTEKACLISNELISTLDYYKFDLVPEKFIVKDIEVDDRLNMDITNDITATHNNQTQSAREEVIDGIINSHQSDLIHDLYENFVEVKSEKMDEESTIEFTVNKWMDPNKFLKTFRGVDYFTVIEEKKNWNSGPQSLEAILDEMLTLGEVKRGTGEDD